jgi:hypothetical protein
VGWAALCFSGSSGLAAAPFWEHKKLPALPAAKTLSTRAGPTPLPWKGR